MGIPLTLSSVPAQTPYQQYVATNGQTVFPYPFEITQDSDLVVVVNGVTLATDSGYSVSGQGNSLGGNVTFNSGQTAGAIVTLFRDIQIERISQIAQNSGFSSTVFNAEFNNIYLLLQQLAVSIGLCLAIPNTNNPAPVTTLLPANYANKYLAFDSNGNPTPALLTSSGALTQAIIAGLLVPQSSAESSAGVTPTNFQYQPFDLRRYGGDPTGASTSDAAMVSAISVCGSTGGTIRAPAGAYKFASPLSLLTKLAIIIQGDGTGGGATTATKFTFTGTSGPLIDMRNAVGVQFRDIQLTHSNAGFTGTYIKCGNGGVNDPSFCGLFNVLIGNTISATLHLDLDKCTLFTCSNVNFINCGSTGAVKGQSNAGSSYSNAIRLRDCLFQGSQGAPIQDGGQAWEIDSCTFEGKSGGSATNAFILSSNSNGNFTGLKITGCWFGDCDSTANTLISLLDSQGVEISGNYISGGTSTTAISMGSNCQGWMITGNAFVGHSVGINFASTVCANIVVKGNIASSVTTPWGNPSNCTFNTLDFTPNFGFGTPSSHGTGSFTATLGGCATAPTATCTWTVNGNIVVLDLPGLTATSNATSLTITGLPSFLQPVNSHNCAVQFLEDSGSGTAGVAQVSNGSGTITFFKGSNTSASAWTSTGTKGLTAVNTITYSLN